MDTIVHSAFTEEQASRLSGVTGNQLKYWDRTGFFRPSLGSENRQHKFSRLYSFKDLVGLKTLNMLINEYAISTKYLRGVRDQLQRPQEVWADTTLYVLGKKVHLEEPQLSSYREPTSGQLTLTHLPLRKVISEVRSAVSRNLERGNHQVGKTSTHRHVVRNSKVFEGTRIPLSTIQSYIEEGYTVDQILAEFPSLKKRDVEKALNAYRGNAA